MFGSFYLTIVREKIKVHKGKSLLSKEPLLLFTINPTKYIYYYYSQYRNNKT